MDGRFTTNWSSGGGSLGGRGDFGDFSRDRNPKLVLSSMFWNFFADVPEMEFNFCFVSENRSLQDCCFMDRAKETGISVAIRIDVKATQLI